MTEYADELLLRSRELDERALTVDLSSHRPTVHDRRPEGRPLREDPDELNRTEKGRIALLTVPQPVGM